MPAPEESSQPDRDLEVFRVAEWTVKRDEGTVTSDGRTRHLQPKVMEVLVFLAANAGRVIPKDEIFQAVWPQLVVEDGALTQCIHAIRRALRDDARQPRYIHTVPRKGYQLVAPVRFGEADEDLPGAPTAAPTRLSWPSNVAAGAALLVILSASAIWLRSSPGLAPNLMILPIQADGSEAFGNLAAGITEELAQKLVRLDHLDLTSRTSARYIASKQSSLQEIRELLDLDYLLEGGMNAAPGVPAGSGTIWFELTQVASDRIVWRREYVVSASDLIGVPSQIALDVVAFLEVPMSSREQQLVGASPSTRPEAMTRYLQGLALLTKRPSYSREDTEKAARSLEQAFELDPSFLAAGVQLVRAHALLYYNLDGTDDRREKAKLALDRVLALDSEGPESRLAAAYYYAYVEEDYERGVENLEDALALQPGDPEVILRLGYFKRRLGRFEEALGHFRTAFDADRLNARLVGDIARTLFTLRRYQAADGWFERALAVDPDVPRLVARRAFNSLGRWACPHATVDPQECSIEPAREVLEDSGIADHPRLASYRFILDLYEISTLGSSSATHDLYPLALDHLHAIPEEERDTSHGFDVFWREAWILRELGRFEEMDRLVDRYRQEYESKIEAGPTSFTNRAFLGVVYAFQGRREDAREELVEAEKYAARDAFSGPQVRQYLALAHTLLGEYEDAATQLGLALAVPYQSAPTRAELLLEPVWEPLRELPEFVSLQRKLSQLESIG